MHLYVYGDSHVQGLIGDTVNGAGGRQYVRREWDGMTLDVMKLHHTGPTMRGLPNPVSATGAGSTLLRELRETGARDVLVVLGEVDCREHIAQAPDLRAAVSKTLDRLRLWEADLPPTLGSLGYLGVHPVQRGLVANRGLWQAPSAVALFNDALREHCLSAGHRFVSVFRETSDGCGLLRPELCLDDGLDVHMVPELVQPLLLDAVRRAFPG